jgi:diamine N-acetyltransferase
MSVAVRPATAVDYDALCALLDEIHSLHCAALPHLFRKPAGPVSEPEYIQALLADENVGLFVADVDGQVAGFIHAVVRESPALSIFVPRRYAVVDTLTVQASHRRRGIGRALMAHVQEWAIAKGATAIELNVHEFNREAIRFYEGLGYKAARRTMSKSLTGAGRQNDTGGGWHDR